MTSAITRRLKGSRVSAGSTRGENWTDPCCITSSDTENAIEANVVVAAATVVSTARALSTVDSPTQEPLVTPTRFRAST